MKFFKNLKIVIILFAVFYNLNINTSNALDFGKNFYGHAVGYLGVGLGHQGGNIWKNKIVTREIALKELEAEFREEWNKWLPDEVKAEYADIEEYVMKSLQMAGSYLDQGTSEVKQVEDIISRFLVMDIKFMFNIGLGYNFYWKAFKTVHPFIGMDLSKHFHISVKELSNTDDLQDELINPKNKEVITFISKIGFKHYVSPIFSFQIYGSIGFTVFDISVKYAKFLKIDDYHERSINLATGCGLDIIIKERFIFGLEYRYLVNKTKTLDMNMLNGLRVKLDTSINLVMLKFGVQFL